MRILTHDQFLDKLRTRLTAAGTQRALAASLGVSQQYLSDVLAERRWPGKKLTGALGYQVVRRFQETA